MVSNHSFKKRVRAYADLRGIRYSEALAIIQRQPFIDYEHFYSSEQLHELKKAAEFIRSGGDVLVYGMTGSGKTSALHGLLESLSGIERELNFFDNFEPWFSSTDPLYHQQLTDSESISNQTTSRVVALDELRRAIPLSATGWENKTLIGVVHGRKEEDAILRANHFFARDWERGGFLKITRTPETGEKHYHFSVKDPYLSLLHARAKTLLRALPDSPVALTSALEKAAAEGFTTVGQMKYALSYSQSMNFVTVNYDDATIEKLV